MKKIFTTTIVFLLASLFTWSVASACIITFTPKVAKVGKDNITTVTVNVKWEHRVCELDYDDVTILLKNLKLLKQTGWKKVKRGLYKNTLKLKLTGKKGILIARRECDKKGESLGKLIIKK